MVQSPSEWQIAYPTPPVDLECPLFFSQSQWNTVEAAVARIIPTDEDPGAREAGVVRFIDCYLSGVDYVYASARGDGFLRLEGKLRDVWLDRIARLRGVYDQGIRQLDHLSVELYGIAFAGATTDQQDNVLEALSGRSRPRPLDAGRSRPAGTTLQSASDDELDFFDALVLHTRQGFYGDPIYGGNKDRIGWRVTGFPGPENLASTNDLTYSNAHYLVADAKWNELIPHLAQSSHVMRDPDAGR